MINHNRSPYREVRWVEVLNGGSGTMTAGSVVRVTATSRPDANRTVHTVSEPNANSQGDLLVVGPLDIEVNDYGLATDANQCYARITGSPSVGDDLGSVSGDLTLNTNQTGWKFHGDLSGGIGRVMRVGGGSSGTMTYIIMFRIESMASNVATVTITARPCNISPVPLESNNQVDVYDRCQCFFYDEPAASLIGRCGWAAYMDPTEDDPTGTGTGTGTDFACRWEIFSLCCPAC